MLCNVSEETMITLDRAARRPLDERAAAAHTGRRIKRKKKRVQRQRVPGSKRDHWSCTFSRRLIWRDRCFESRSTDHMNT